jgi:hypothetical protein
VRSSESVVVSGSVCFAELLLLRYIAALVDGRGGKEEERKGGGKQEGKGGGAMQTNEGRDASSIVCRACTMRGEYLHTSIVIFLISSILDMHISVTFFAASTCATSKRQRTRESSETHGGTAETLGPLQTSKKPKG